MSSATDLQRPPPSRLSPALLTWAIVATSGLMVFGVHLDAWAHHRFALESFFTPWHGLLYSSYAALAALLVLQARRGGRPLAALREGHGHSLTGAVLFAVGGLADLGWHTLLGIEVNVEALLSPPHLLLAGASGLMVSGPLRGAHRCRQAPDWPAVTSMALLLSVLTFFTAYANPLAEQTLLRQGDPSLGVAGVVLQSLLLVGVILAGLRSGLPPRGTMTVLIGLSGGLMLLVHMNFVLMLPLFATGLLADLLLQWVRPTADRPVARHLFAAAVPGLMFTLVLGTQALTGELSWSWTLASGAVTSAALAGWLLSLSVPSVQAHRSETTSSASSS